MRQLITIQEAARITGLSPHTLYGMVSRRQIPYLKVGRLLRFDVELLDRWLKERTVMPMPSRAVDT